VGSWFSRFFGKKADSEEPEELLEYAGYTIYDEETGRMLSVLMVCGCGEPVVVAGGLGDNFYCEHCDRICLHDKPCELCELHYMFDAEAVKAEYAADFDYGEEEE